MVSLMAKPGEIYKNCELRLAMAGNPAGTEQRRSAMDAPIQRVASHLIQTVVKFGADLPANTERYAGPAHPKTVSIYKGCSLACAKPRLFNF
jgi:hypothetical protein